MTTSDCAPSRPWTGIIGGFRRTRVPPSTRNGCRGRQSGQQQQDRAAHPTEAGMCLWAAMKAICTRCSRRSVGSAGLCRQRRPSRSGSLVRHTVSAHRYARKFRPQSTQSRLGRKPHGRCRLASSDIADQGRKIRQRCIRPAPRSVGAGESVEYLREGLRPVRRSGRCSRRRREQGPSCDWEVAEHCRT